MSAPNMIPCIGRVLAHEGGYTNDAEDPGGPTNFGITIIDARLYWKKDATASDVARMPQSVAIDIYKAKYWAKVRADELPSGVDYAIFDYGVNSGVGRAGKVLRRLLSMDASTGTITDEVIAAARKRDPALLVSAICDERLRFLQSLKTWPHFGNGWGRRVREVRSYALALVKAGSATVTTAPATTTVGKAVPPAPKVVKKVVGPAIGGTGVVTFTMADWLSAHPFEAAGLALGAVVLIGAAATLYMRWHQAAAEAPMPGLLAVPELGSA